MNFEISKRGNPLFVRIHPFLAEMIKSVAEDPWEEYPEGSARLLPPPGTDEELLTDWSDHVQPDLRRRFDDDRSQVAQDIGTMKPGRGKLPVCSLEIPIDHVDAWLTTLNALRLAIVTEHGFGEEELAHKTSPDLSTFHGIALLKVNFFAFLQECLLQGLESRESESGDQDSD
jgi:hypothetical protein